MTQELITRKEYLERSSELFAAAASPQDRDHRAASARNHHEYVSQFVTDETLRHVAQRFPVEQLASALAEDGALNSIPIKEWDALSWRPSDPESRSARSGGGSGPFRSTVPFDRELFARADPYGATRADLVCISKAAARILVERHQAAQAVAQ